MKPHPFLYRQGLSVDFTWKEHKSNKKRRNEVLPFHFWGHLDNLKEEKALVRRKMTAKWFREAERAKSLWASREPDGATACVFFPNYFSYLLDYNIIISL